VAQVRIGQGDGAIVVPSFAGERLGRQQFARESERFSSELRTVLADAGYPTRADPGSINYPMVIAICTLLVIYVTMVYGPIAAWLVELFPAHIRYSSMSLPYHIGNGWFGGFLPVTSFAIVAATGDIYAGLWYPVGIALLTVVVGSLFLRETYADEWRTSAQAPGAIGRRAAASDAE